MTFEQGDRVTFRPGRAQDYGLPRGEVYTVASTRPHPRYARTWIVLVELVNAGNGTGTVDSREIRPA